MKNIYYGIVESNGQGERDSIFMPTILFFMASIISAFCFFVAQYEWALWFWHILAWGYSISAIICLIFIIISLLDN